MTKDDHVVPERNLSSIEIEERLNAVRIGYLNLVRQLADQGLISPETLADDIIHLRWMYESMGTERDKAYIAETEELAQMVLVAQKK